MSSKTNNLGYKVSWRDINWLQLVERAWGPEFLAPDHGAYEWSNGRKFDSSDKWRSGIYGVDCPYPFEFEYHYENEAPYNNVKFYNGDMDSTLGNSDQRTNELLYIDGDPSVGAGALFVMTEDCETLLAESGVGIREEILNVR